jgi:hypothetical protein
VSKTRRPCLGCDREFPSEHIGNRFCKRCRKRNKTNAPYIEVTHIDHLQQSVDNDEAWAGLFKRTEEPPDTEPTDADT